MCARGLAGPRLRIVAAPLVIAAMLIGTRPGAAPAAEVAATPLRMLAERLGLRLGSCAQMVPFQCSVRVR